MTTSINSNVNTYDEVPYESYPYANSYPGHLKTVGTLFGMTPPALETAKILELGCAAGGNIIPIAMRYPKSKCVGVDLSSVQIDQANASVKGLGLKNMEFHCASITDVNEKYGKFDYIVCHGVISWVPENVREAILKTCGSLLTENGLAYVSYNTLPGWNMVRSIREMMLYHSELFGTIQEKVQQSRLLLDFVKDSLSESKAPYAEMLRTEAGLLAQQPDHYLRHDHLEETNRQFYFHEFMQEAAKSGLQYVGDASVSSMFLGNMPTKVAEKLQAVNDVVRTEQYMDFINNRRFRSTIMCKNTVKLNRALNAEDIKKFYLNFKLVAEKAIGDIDINDSTIAQFYFNGNKDSAISTSSPGMKAILYVFAEHWNQPLSFDEIVKLAAKKLPKVKQEVIVAEFLNNGMRMVLSGHINVSVEKPCSISAVKAKPKVSALTLWQATHVNGLWVTNEMHERLGINLLEKYALRYMDGKHTNDEIASKLLEHIAKGEMTVSKDGNKLEDEKQIKPEISAALQQSLERLKVSAVFVE